MMESICSRRDTQPVTIKLEYSSMTQGAAVSVQFRLEAAGLGFAMDIGLRSHGERWIAVADIGGKSEVGIGRNARQALEAALAPLGQRVAATCLQDLALLGPSVEIARQQRAIAG
jgi:hypothetical protein